VYSMSILLKSLSNLADVCRLSQASHEAGLPPSSFVILKNGGGSVCVCGGGGPPPNLLLVEMVYLTEV
jgi:hypothetical protein